MKRNILLYCLIAFFTEEAFASQCFITKENGQIIQQKGDCDKRYSPASTFKIPLSIMGYNSQILIDETHPVWPFKESYVDWREVWKQDQNPQSWIKNSCVWYSQVLTKKLGIKNFQSYVIGFNYGNMDLSGDVGQNNGITNAWLSSSLEISSIEQIVFLEKLLNATLPVRQLASEMTKNILFLEELPNSWKLYGKTGSGFLLNGDRTKKLSTQHGWFVGWIEKGDKRIIFSNHITDDKEEDSFASLRAKTGAKARLIKIINDIEGS